jgi:hypothetical protein
MVLTVAKTKSFYPTFNNNLDLPEDERVKITYKMPTLQLKNQLKPRSPMRFDIDPASGRTERGVVEINVNKEEVVKALLVRIDNFACSDEKGEHKVTNWAELLQGPRECSELVDEMYTEFKKELDYEIDEKN